MYAPAKSIVCAETGKQYTSIKAAAKALHLAPDAIRRALSSGMRVQGFSFYMPTAGFSDMPTVSCALRKRSILVYADIQVNTRSSRWHINTEAAGTDLAFYRAD
eukprot:g27007.t1